MITEAKLLRPLLTKSTMSPLSRLFRPKQNGLGGLVKSLPVGLIYTETLTNKDEQKRTNVLRKRTIIIYM